MSKILIGIVIGIVVASVGFGGVAQVLDRGVQAIQQTSKDLTQ